MLPGRSQVDRGQFAKILLISDRTSERLAESIELFWEADRFCMGMSGAQDPRYLRGRFADISPYMD